MASSSVGRRRAGALALSGLVVVLFGGCGPGGGGAGGAGDGGSGAGGATTGGTGASSGGRALGTTTNPQGSDVGGTTGGTGGGRTTAGTPPATVRTGASSTPLSSSGR
jgi:hypothetical protein